MISNATDEALVILAEECGEVIQAVAKIHRWGPHEWYGTGPTNLDQLATELGDLKAMIDIAITELGIEPQQVEDAQANKKIKLTKYSKCLQHYG